MNIYNLTPKCIFYVKNLKLCNLSNEQTRDAKFLENAAILQNSFTATILYIYFLNILLHNKLSTRVSGLISFNANEIVYRTNKYLIENHTNLVEVFVLFLELNPEPQIPNILLRIN